MLSLEQGGPEPSGRRARGSGLAEALRTYECAQPHATSLLGLLPRLQPRDFPLASHPRSCRTAPARRAGRSAAGRARRLPTRARRAGERRARLRRGLSPRHAAVAAGRLAQRLLGALRPAQAGPRLAHGLRPRLALQAAGRRGAAGAAGGLGPYSGLLEQRPAALAAADWRAAARLGEAHISSGCRPRAEVPHAEQLSAWLERGRARGRGPARAAVLSSRGLAISRPPHGRCAARSRAGPSWRRACGRAFCALLCERDGLEAGAAAAPLQCQLQQDGCYQQHVWG